MLKARLPAHFFQDISLLSILAGFLYFLWLGSYPLFTPDEGRYAEIAREMLLNHQYVTPRVNGIPFLDKPILHYWMQCLSQTLLGTNEWGIRFFPALLGVIGIVSVYAFARFFYNRRTAWLAAILLSLTPLYFAGAHYANLDLEVAVFISLSCLCLCAALQNKAPPRHLMLWAYFFAGLGFLQKGIIGIAFPALIGTLYLLSEKRFRTFCQLHLGKGLVLLILMIAPWYYFAERATPGFLHYFFITQQFDRLLSTAEFNNPTPVWFYLPLIVVGFFPWSLLIPNLIFNRPKSRDTIQRFLWIWTLAILVVFSIPNSKIITYILPIFPPLALLCGHSLALGLTEMRQRFTGLYTSYALINLALALILFALPHTGWINLPQRFFIYCYAFGSILILSLISCLFALRSAKLKIWLLIASATNLVLLITFLHGAAILNQNSAKRLVALIKPELKAEDKIVIYFKYYQDIPIYLDYRKPIIIAANWNDAAIPKRDNWLREMWYGNTLASKPNWLIDETQFWQLWQSQTRLYVFLNQNYLEQFQQQKLPYQLLGQQDDIMLVRNH